ncbi:MAG TPA: AAA family ATPase, partial [Symbiobacteriaceae bacterium]|nr:AAA family ATPase [Symbiobacteriaceae bacterium]
MLQQDWLVQTKIHPPLRRADTIDRQRLFDLLRTAVTTRPVTLVSAPAGYGKTTLLAALPDLLPVCGHAWVSLDAEENDPVRFFGALTAALQRLAPAFGASQAAQADAEPRRLAGLLVNEVLEHLPDPFTLVLDDLHLVTEPAIFVALDYLIERLPPQMHLVISTRHDPPLPLARLAARRQLAEIRRPHLSFTADEADLLLNGTLGLALPPDLLGALEARTEGWAAGLCLLAASLEQVESTTGREALLNSLAQTDRYVYEFLADEVLSRQEPAVRSFLLQTAILPDLTPALCAAVTDRSDSRELLEALYRRNLFLVATPDGTYRYHALFAEFLRAQLTCENPDLMPTCYRRAAAAESSPVRAIPYWLAAGAWPEAAEALLKHGQGLLHAGLATTLQGWLEALPEPVCEAHPYLMIMLAGCQMQRGAFQPAGARCARAARLFAAAGDAQGEGLALSNQITCAVNTLDLPTLIELIPAVLSRPVTSAARIRALTARMGQALGMGDWRQSAADLQECLAIAMAEQQPPITTVVAYHLGPLFVALPGCLEPTERFVTQALNQASEPFSPLRLALAEVQALTHLLRGRVDQAVAAAESALALKERLGGFPWLGLHAAGYLATIAAARGDQEAARRYLALLETQLDGAPAAQLPVWIYTAARTYSLLGQPAEARQRLEQLRRMTGFTLPPVAVYERRLTGLLALGERRFAEAEAALHEALRLEEQLPCAAAPGSVGVLQARLALDRNRPDEALALIRPLLAACEAEETAGYILQEGALILPVLRLAAASPGPGS